MGNLRPAILRLFLACCLIASLVLAAAGSQAGQALNLSEAIALALKHDPETQGVKRSIDISKLKRSKAIQGFLPKTEVGFNYGPQTDYFGKPVTDQNVFYTYSGIEQPLYAGGTLVNSLKMANTETRRQEKEYQTRRLGLAAETVKAYYQTLTAQATVAQYEALKRQGTEELKNAQSRFDAGTATRQEFLEITAKLLEIDQKLSKSRADHEVALSSLKRLLGVDDVVRLDLAPGYPLADIQADSVSLMTEAQDKRPDLAYYKEDFTYNQLRTQVERGKQLPQLSLIARYEWQSPQLVNERKDWMVMLKASVSWENSTLSYGEQRSQLYPNIYAFPTAPGYPERNYAFSVRSFKYSLFDRSTNKVELAQAKSDRELSRDKLTQAKLTVYYDVKDALAKKNDSAARIQTAKQQIRAAEELVHINKTKYQLGYTSLTEVFKAQTSLAEAQVNLVTAQNDYAIALGQLYKTLGRDLIVKE